MESGKTLQPESLVRPMPVFVQQQTIQPLKIKSTNFTTVDEVKAARLFGA